MPVAACPKCPCPLLGQHGLRIWLLASSQTSIWFPTIPLNKTAWLWTDALVTFLLSSGPPAAFTGVLSKPRKGPRKDDLWCRNGVGLGSKNPQIECTDHSKTQPVCPMSDSQLSASWTNHSSSKATGSRKGKGHWLLQPSGWHHAGHLSLAPGNLLRQGRWLDPSPETSTAQTGNLGSQPLFLLDLTA